MKGYTNQKKQGDQNYITLQPIGSDKFAADMLPKALFQVGAIRTVEATSTTKQIKLTAHGARIGDVLRFFNGLNQSVEAGVVEIIDADHMLLGMTLDNDPLVTDTFYLMRHITLTIDSNGSLQVASTYLTPVAYMEAAAGIPQDYFLDPSITTIPKSSLNAIQITTALANDVKKVTNHGDVGFYMALYSDAARANLLCILSLTPDETVEVAIPAGTVIYLGALKDVDIVDVSTLVLQFLG